LCVRHPGAGEWPAGQRQESRTARSRCDVAPDGGAPGVGR
jgi:hypothetical protein